MGYHVRYAPFRQTKEIPKRLLRVSVLSVLFLIVFCILVNRTWPRGAEVLRGFLFSEELVVSAAALENMAQQLHSGGRVTDALFVFWDKLSQILRG